MSSHLMCIFLRVSWEVLKDNEATSIFALWQEEAHNFVTYADDKVVIFLLFNIYKEYLDLFAD